MENFFRSKPWVCHGQYDLFQTNPEEVDPDLRSFFEVSGPPSLDVTVGAVLGNATTQPWGKSFQ